MNFKYKFGIRLTFKKNINVIYIQQIKHIDVNTFFEFIFPSGSRMANIIGFGNLHMLLVSILIGICMPSSVIISLEKEI